MNKQITEVRGMDTRELRGKLAELRKEQFDLRFRGASEQIAKPSRFRELRRSIARITLVLAERQKAEQAGGKQAAGGRKS
jgi:large subunit ribosomal protein L29